jgi:hypothetical protein
MGKHKYFTRRDFAARVKKFGQASPEERTDALAMWRARATTTGAWLAPTVSAAVAGMTSLIAIGFSIVIATSNSSIGFSQYWLKKSDEFAAAGQTQRGEVTKQLASDMVDRAFDSAFNAFALVGTTLIAFVVLMIIVVAVQSWQQGIAVAYRDAFEDVVKEEKEKEKETEKNKERPRSRRLKVAGIHAVR